MVVDEGVQDTIAVADAAIGKAIKVSLLPF